MTTPTTNNHTDSLKTPCSHSSTVVSIDVVTGNDKKLRNRPPLQTSRRSGAARGALVAGLASVIAATCAGGTLVASATGLQQRGAARKPVTLNPVHDLGFLLVHTGYVGASSYSVIVAPLKERDLQPSNTADPGAPADHGVVGKSFKILGR